MIDECIVFIFSFEMSWYPFDTQKCLLEFIMEESMADFVKPSADKLQYLGNKELALYYVRDITMEERIVNGNPAVVVEISLGRHVFIILLTTYLTSFIINVVGRTTAFFKASFLHTKIGVNLTVMLVLTTMFIVVLHISNKVKWLTINARDHYYHYHHG